MPDPRAAVARVVLVGVSCVGKTTVGRRVADVLACPFIDFDEAIDAHYGCALGRIKGDFSRRLRSAAQPHPSSRAASRASPTRASSSRCLPAACTPPHYRMLRSAAAAAAAVGAAAVG